MISCQRPSRSLGPVPPLPVSSIITRKTPTAPPPLLTWRAIDRPVDGDSLDFEPAHYLSGGEIRGAMAVARQTSRLMRPAPCLLRAACHETRFWSVPGATRPLIMTMGLAPGEPLGTALVEHIGAALTETGLIAEALEIRIDQAWSIQAGAEALLALSALRDIGVGLAMEQPGLEHDGPEAQQCRLPLTCLRLNARIVASLADDRDARRAARRFIADAHAMDIEIVAAGVGTPMARDILGDLRCDAAQGPVFSHPLPSLAFREALQQIA